MSDFASDLTDPAAGLETVQPPSITPEGGASVDAAEVDTFTVVPSVATIDPVTRIEGHLKIRVQTSVVNGLQKVIDAWSTGTLFRGLETMLNGRKPWDAIHITQRICGVCPVSHGLAATRTIEMWQGLNPNDNGRILRNLVLGANFVQSHILHFYHLALLDYMDGPAAAPWDPSWSVDMRIDVNTASTLMGHYVQALEMRRKAHEVGAVFGGRLPHPPTYVPGGFTCPITTAGINAVKAYLNTLIPFLRDVYIPDVQLLAAAYPDYYRLGRGWGHLLAFGVFDLDAAGTTKLLRRGRLSSGATIVQGVNLDGITESVTHSWYGSGNNLKPSAGATTPQYPKTNAYSWLKAPRHADSPYEVGPLARMYINGDYRRGISVMDRHQARAAEALKVATAMLTWVNQLVPGQNPFTPHTPKTSGTGYGLTEAPRGALGHWATISNGAISRYQVITPTCWNFSPRDTKGVRGPLEQALVGTPVQDIAKPIEVLRVIHSFDPCLSCAVHVLDADTKAEVVVPVTLRGAPR